MDGSDGIDDAGGSLPSVSALDAARVVELLRSDPVRWGDTALLEGVRDTLSLIRTAEACLLAQLAEVDTRGLALDLGAADTAALLRAHSDLGPRAARRLVATACTVAGDAELRAALRSGAVSAEGASVVTSTLDRLPRDLDADTYSRARRLLLGWAAEHDREALRRLAKRLQARVVAEHTGVDTLAAAEARAYANRGLWLSRLGAGWVLRADLDGEVGGLLAAMIDRCSKPSSDRALPGGSEPDREGARVAAVWDPRDAAVRRADAFEQIVRSAAAHADLPTHGGSRPTLTVLTELDALRGGLPGVGGVDESGEPLSAAAIRRLACDADVLPVVLGTESEVLDLGRTARLVPAPLRRALAVRDRGCVWPGCDRPPSWTDAHHVTHWVDGGETSLANCVLLCRRHHTRAHRGDWQIQVGPHGAELVPPAWVDPSRTPRRNSRDHHPEPGRRLPELAARQPSGVAPTPARPPRPPART